MKEAAGAADATRGGWNESRIVPLRGVVWVGQTMGIESTGGPWAVAIGVASRGSSPSRQGTDDRGRMVESLVGGDIRSILCVFADQEHTSSTRAGASGCIDDGWRLRGVSQALPPNRSPEDLLRGESFDQDHRAAAARTEPRAWQLRLGGYWRGRSPERRSFQQSMAKGQPFAAAAVSEEAAEADAHKAARQGVEQEPPQKLLCGHGHEPLLALFGCR